MLRHRKLIHEAIAFLLQEGDTTGGRNGHGRQKRKMEEMCQIKATMAQLVAENKARAAENKARAAENKAQAATIEALEAYKAAILSAAFHNPAEGPKKVQRRARR